MCRQVKVDATTPAFVLTKSNKRITKYPAGTLYKLETHIRFKQIHISVGLRIVVNC